MRWLAAIAMLAGCHGGSATPRPPARTPYLALFEKGKAWTLPISSGGTVTCRVADTRPIADATVAHVTCDAPHAGLLVVGSWVATPAGLYHPLVPVDEPDELTLLGEDDLLLAANATEREHSHSIDGAHDDIEAFVFKSSWCVRETTTAGSDRRSYTLCFDASGITGGAEAVTSNGTEQSTTFGALPPPEPTED